MTRNIISVCAQPAMIALALSTCTVTAPTASFNAISNICVGQNLSLTNVTTGGATNYSWTIPGGSPSTSTLQSLITNYAGAGVYTINLVATNGIGTSNQTKTVNVVAIPSVSVTSTTICSGNSATLTASGTTSYTWNPGGLTGANQTLNPALTTVYTVIGSNGTCTNSANATLNVNPTPTVSAISSASVLCAGQTVTVTATGATNYTWNPGALNGNSQTLSPATSTTYTVSGESALCYGNSVISLSVTICTGINKNNISENLVASYFPNPTTGNITINFIKNYTGYITLINALGQIILTKTIDGKENTAIDLSNYAKGIYVVKFSSDKNGVSFLKVVKD